MKIEISHKTLRELSNLKGRWLLLNKDIHIIKDFQYIVETPERKRRRKEPKEIFYLTSIKIRCYNNDLKYVGVYTDDYCERLISEHDSCHYTLNLYTFATAWEHLKDQINALREHEGELKPKSETPIKDAIKKAWLEK